MKNITKSIIIFLIILLLAGCTAHPDKITKLEDLDGKTVAFMSIPIPVESMKADLEERSGSTFKELLYFDTFPAAVAALKGGKADAVLALGPTIDYYTARDNDLTAIIPVNQHGENSFRRALRSEDTELMDNINDAISSMKSNGVLDTLEQEFIRNLQPDKQLIGKEMPRYDGAPTLYVGLAGDNPPIDYVAADGKPAGYNLELLTKLSEALHINFEIMVIPSETKFSALASKKIDIFFLHPIVENIKATTQTMAENQNIRLSEAYYISDSEGYLVLK